MKTNWRGLLLLLIWFPVCATAQSQPNPRGTIQGIVVDSETGKPLPEAVVDLAILYHAYGRARVASTRTNSEGVFRFREKPNEYYFLTAAKGGYVSDEAKPEKQLSLGAGDRRTGFVFKLLREGVVRGRLTDADGDLVAGTTLGAWQWRFAGGQRYLAQFGSVSLWPDGSFRIGGLRPGLVFLSAVRSWEYADYGGQPRKDSSAPTFYRSAVDAASAEPIRIAPGVEIDNIQLRMRRTTLYRVRGRVTGPAGMERIALSICAEWLPRYCLNALVRGDGQFVADNVPAGQYEIRGEALTRVPQPQSLRAIQLVTVNDDLGEVLVAYSPTPEIRTTIQGGQGSFHLLAIPENIYTDNLRHVSDGRSPHVVGVFPGRYRPAAVDLPEGMYVESIRSGDRDVISGFQLTMAGLTLDIVLARGAANVSGAVRDGQGKLLAEVPVTVWSEAHGGPGFMRTVLSDEDGEYELANLPPGVYRIAAWQGIGEGIAQYREFFEAFGREAKAIQLAAGASLQIDLNAISESAAAVQAAKVR